MREPNVVSVVIWMMILTLGLPNICPAGNRATAIEGEPLVLHFDRGKTNIMDADKVKIKRLLDGYKLTQGCKILVLGHTDDSGDAQDNLRLSIKRAQAVRRQLVSIIGGNIGNDILAIGKGSDHPVADNGTQEGRSQNRRAEIYLAQMVSGRLVGKRESIQADKAFVEKLVQDARVLLRRNQPQDALQVLRKAYAQGGDQFSSWNGVLGIAGYYTGMSSGKIRSYLSAALELDPFNHEAREYLGRVEARDKVASGIVTPAMGRSPDNAIAILSNAQAHEYLQLFDVRVLSHTSLAQRGIEAWRCRDAAGKIVIYHFDRSKMYEGLFEQLTPVDQMPDRSHTKEAMPSSFLSGYFAGAGLYPFKPVSNSAGVKSATIGEIPLID